MLLVSSKASLPQRSCYIYGRANSLTKTLKEILPYYLHKTEATEEDPIKPKQQEQYKALLRQRKFFHGLKNYRWKDDKCRKKKRIGMSELTTVSLLNE